MPKITSGTRDWGVKYYGKQDKEGRASIVEGGGDGGMGVGGGVLLPTL